jgi:hypothetical protein
MEVKNMTQNKPIKKFIAGGVHLAIWKNANQVSEAEQRTSYSVSLERCYKDKMGNWKSTTTLREPDLPKATLLLSKAYEFVLQEGKDPEVSFESI